MLDLGDGLALAVADLDIGNGVALEDLMMCGAIGLTLAADRFDATRGYRFLTYATWMVEAELKKAVAKKAKKK